MKASDLFLRCLEKQGVEIIFGVPGEENADLMISLLDSKIKFVTCRHEQSAAFMADMYGRLTGKPGVCLATLGPGATNLLTGVANANMDHAPLIAIIGQASTNRLHKESHQNMDAISMYKPVTKWATTIREADVIPEIIDKAFKVATELKPGAVLLEFPEDIAKQKTSAKPIISHKNYSDYGVSITLCQQALDLIAKSKKPLLLIGAGCNRCDCTSELMNLIDRAGIYFATTFMGKGAVSDDHAQSLFCVGLGIKDIALEAFDQVDLIITVGYDMVEWHPDRWNEGHKKKIIHIDIIPAEVDKNYLPEIELIGSLKAILAEINNHLTVKQEKERNLFATIREKISADIHAYDHDNATPLKPQKILAELRAILHDEDILISDVGAHKMWAARQYPAYKSKTCFIYNGFCSMGGAIPGAISAKYLEPKRQVVALCGDGGFIMSIQALSTAVELKLPIIIMIWVDDAYGLIKWKQEISYHEYSHVDFANPDFIKLAHAFGCDAISVNSAKELTSALQTATKNETKPTVIIVPVDYSENMKLTNRLGDIVSR